MEKAKKTPRERVREQMEGEMERVKKENEESGKTEN